TNRLMAKSISSGTENLLYQTSDSVGAAVLTPSRVAFEDLSVATVYEYRNGSLFPRGPASYGELTRKGNFIFWGKDCVLYLGDLLTTNTYAVTNNCAGY